MIIAAAPDLASARVRACPHVSAYLEKQRVILSCQHEYTTTSHTDVANIYDLVREVLNPVTVKQLRAFKASG